MTILRRARLTSQFNLCGIEWCSAKFVGALLCNRPSPGRQTEINKRLLEPIVAAHRLAGGLYSLGAALFSPRVPQLSPQAHMSTRNHDNRMVEETGEKRSAMNLPKQLAATANDDLKA